MSLTTEPETHEEKTNRSQKEIDNSTIIVVDFNTQLSLMHRASNQKVNKKRTDVTNKVNTRILHPAPAEDTFFLSTQGTYY